MLTDIRLEHAALKDLFEKRVGGSRKTRKCLAIEVDTSLPAARVIRALEQPKEEQSPPNQIRIDNGPEPIATEFYDSCRDHDIDVAYRQPLDGFVERFNGSFRRVFWMHTCLKPEPKLEKWLGNG